MRLSEAIALGRSLTDNMTETLYIAADCACAIGMAELAIGMDHHNRAIVETEWPWLKQVMRKTCPFCNENFATDGIGWVGHVMGHVRGTVQVHFVFSSFTRLEKCINLDQLINWVRSIEPNEESKVANVNSNASTTGQQSSQGSVTVATKTGK